MYRIVPPSESHEHFCRSLPLAALEEHLPEEEIHEICHDLGHAWRARQLPPGVTIRSCVHRALNGDHSIAALLADLAAADDLDAPVPTDSAWCQARSRVPLTVFRELIARRARRCQRRFGAPYRWQGRRVLIVDGSTVSMPDEPELVEAFGYAPTRHGPSRFPVARITFIELAGLEVIWDYRLDDYRTSEDEQFQEMWLHSLLRHLATPTIGCIVHWFARPSSAMAEVSRLYLVDAQAKHFCDIADIRQVVAGY